MSEPPFNQRRVACLSASLNAPRQVAVSKIRHISHLVIPRTFRHQAKGGKRNGPSAFARGYSSVTPSLLNRKLGAVKFSNLSNARIVMKSGWSSLVGCATITWIHKLDSTSKGGSDGHLNLAISQEWRPAYRLARHFEGRRQCQSDEKWLISSILCPMKSRQHSLERAH